MTKSREFSATGVAALTIVIVAATSGIAALFSPEIMMLFAPSEYFEGAYAIAPIAASNVALMLFSVYVTVEYYFSDTLPIPVVSVLAAILNFFLNYLLVPVFGFVFAGYATLVCYGFLAMGHALLCKRTVFRHLDGRSPVSIAKLLCLTVCLVLVILAFQFFYQWLVIRLFVLFAIGVALLVNRKRILNTFSTVKSVKR